MVREGKPTKRAGFYCSLVIRVALLGAKIVHFDHSAVKNGEKAHQIFLLVAVKALYALSRKATSDDSVCDVCQI